MFSTHGAMLIPAPAGSAEPIYPSPTPEDWPGFAQAAELVGVSLNDTAIDHFGRYRDLLLRRNAQFNLTAIRGPEGIERRLFLDALGMVPALDDAIEMASGRNLRVVDIGAGAGFPGLPLKIARPEIEITLVDATGKKVAFLNEVIAELRLDHARALHGRAEVLGQDHAYRERFDVAVARAVAHLSVLLEYVIPFLSVGGTALLPKGLQIDEELDSGRRAAAALGSDILSADRLPVEGTRLVVAAKTSATPARYPRDVGVPSRSPLGRGP